VDRFGILWWEVGRFASGCAHRRSLATLVGDFGVAVELISRKDAEFTEAKTCSLAQVVTTWTGIAL
jgi:hypothetical protein